MLNIQVWIQNCRRTDSIMSLSQFSLFSDFMDFVFPVSQVTDCFYAYKLCPYKVNFINI